MATFLVGVTHGLAEGQDDNLMAPTVQEKFKEVILPKITNRSLILCEGINRDHLITVKHPEYDRIRTRMFADSLGSTRPTLGGVDLRQTPSDTDANLILQMYAEWHKTAAELTMVDLRNFTLPTSLSGVIEVIRRGGLHAELKRRPTIKEKELARLVAEVNKKFDRRYLAVMQSYAHKYDQCFFVGGCCHVVSMALKSKHQVIDLTPPELMKEIFFSSLSDRWTRLFQEAP